jgi:hypothetical protein
MSDDHGSSAFIRHHTMIAAEIGLGSGDVLGG